MKNQAFTLIELLVVILIIGIIAAIAFAQYKKVIFKTKATEMIAIAKNIRENQKQYYLVNNQYASNINNLDIEFPSCEWSFTGTSSVGTCPNGLLYVYDTGMISIYMNYDENKTPTPLWINLFSTGREECSDRETTDRCKILGYKICDKPDSRNIYRCYNS